LAREDYLYTSRASLRLLSGELVGVRRLTAFIDDRFVFDVLRANSKTSEKGINEGLEAPGSNGNEEETHLRVLSVSCLNLFPGAKLHINNPTEDPPSASCRIRVSLEFR
jgi:hypothetical protein